MRGRRGFAGVTMCFACLALLMSIIVMGCGKSEQARPSDESKPAPVTRAGENEVLVVIANADFADGEYSAVEAALEGAGYRVVVANSSGRESVGSQNTRVKPDITIGQVNAADYAGVVLIGGPGAEEYFDSAQLQAVAGGAVNGGEVVAAICMAPVILANAGLLRGRKGTVFPGEKGRLEAGGCVIVNEPVVVDGKMITADGPQSARPFADAVVKALKEKEGT